ncbi:MAG: hypothetical protein FJ216_01320 [Ignavibacteria bacterium]|nr:hypothetical protein [Ignavibacteria bacterium]
MKSGGLGKIFKKDEIVKYKEDWEKYCKDNPIIFKKKKKGMKKEINNKLDFYILFSCELKDMISKLEYFIEAAIPYCNKTEKEKYWNEGNKILYDFETLYEKYRIFSNLRLDDKMKILFNNLKEAIKQSSYSQIHYSSFDKNNDYKHWAKAVELSDNASKLISITYKIRNEIIDEIRNVLK